MTTKSFDDISDLERFLADRNMNGFWNSPRATDEVKPYLWKWDDIYRGLTAAAEMVPMTRVAMRTVQFKNPGLAMGMSRTLHFSVQILQPGERTKAHRNLVGETRFVLQAPPGAIFIVDGEPFPMEAGDLITTPNWSWHDHYNGGDTPAIWLDGMDMRLVSALGKAINEPFPNEHQPVEKSEGYSSKTVGSLARGWIKDERLSAPFHYKWPETAAALAAVRQEEGDADPFDGVRLTYKNPLTGGPTLPTYACEIQLLFAGETTKRHRHNSTTIYHAFRGTGVTEVEGERLQWSQGDVFVVPPWGWHSHEAGPAEDAVLYSITDRPALEALGLYREDS
jgi:gentisate 1,2-dioxygenase